MSNGYIGKIKNGATQDIKAPHGEKTAAKGRPGSPAATCGPAARARAASEPPEGIPRRKSGKIRREEEKWN